MKWDNLCPPKSQGGLEFRDLSLFISAMLNKQGWNMVQDNQSLCSKFLKAKHFANADPMNAKLGRNLFFYLEMYLGFKLE